MTEREFQRDVIRYAREKGWRVAHFGNSVKYVKRGREYRVIPDPDARGFPDLTMAREGRLVFAELKGSEGRLTETQKEWLEALKAVPELEVYVWKPDALTEIHRVLE